MKLKHLFAMEVVIILIFLVSFAASHAAAAVHPVPHAARLTTDTPPVISASVIRAPVPHRR